MDTRYTCDRCGEKKPREEVSSFGSFATLCDEPCARLFEVAMSQLPRWISPEDRSGLRQILARSFARNTKHERVPG